jgi:hypothetical protein
MPVVHVHHYHDDGGGGRPSPVYRSKTARRAMMIVGLFIVYATTIGPANLRTGNASVQLIANAVPLPVLAALFAVYVILLAFPVRRVLLAGYLLGGGLYLVILCASLWVAAESQPVNPYGLAALILAVVLHLMAYRTVYFDHDMDGRPDDRPGR